ncbi:MAG: hypothetical protein DRR19_24600 [Candidatus Parabeggiatoa sp. nov. 1]|nr:MAG: hypothetical protein DRR19_24600 [Gammaproteobacteria bacterium]
MKKDEGYIEYKDEYSSCERTYVTLSFYHEKLHSDEVTKVLIIKPTRTTEKNEQRKINKNGWFFSTQDTVESRDVRRHLRFLLDIFKNKENEVNFLRNEGWSTKIYCFWESTEGNGGPILDYRTMELLSIFKLDIHFDVWWIFR